MALVREILLLGHPLLRIACSEVVYPLGADLAGTITDLIDTLRDFRQRNGFGRGIAAPQIGVLKRVIAVVEPEELVLINPTIVGRKGHCLVWDDCFSLPELMVRLSRAETITVEYRNSCGSLQRLTASGELSELLQHEIDHLNGTVILDHADNSSQVMMRPEWQRQIGIGLISQ